MHYQSFLDETTNDAKVQDESLFEDIEYLHDEVEDESLLEDIEYLGETDFENMEYLECCDNTDDTDLVVCDTESESPGTSPINARHFLYQSFLSVVLCLLFLANILAQCVKSSNVIKQKLEKLNAKVKLLQTENFYLRCSVKNQTNEYNSISKHLTNLEESIGHIYNSDQLNIFKKKLKRPKKWDDKTILKSLKTKLRVWLTMVTPYLRWEFYDDDYKE